MVCHETYQDEKNKWLSPEEVFTNDGKNYFQRKTKKKIKVGPSINVQIKKYIDPENMIYQYGADSVRFYFSWQSIRTRYTMVRGGMISSYKFIQKLSVLSIKFMKFQN